MENTQRIIEGIILGLSFSCLYLGSSYLAVYLSLYWNLCEPSSAWIIVGFITYSCLYESGFGLKGITIGAVSIIAMWLYHSIAGTQPQLWIYFVVNSIVCINIITTSIRKTFER